MKGGAGYFQKSWVWCEALFPKPLPIYDQNLHFVLPFYNLTKNSVAYLQPLQAFVGSLIDNDEKVHVALSTKHMHYKTRMLKLTNL